MSEVVVVVMMMTTMMIIIVVRPRKVTKLNLAQGGGARDKDFTHD